MGASIIIRILIVGASAKEYMQEKATSAQWAGRAHEWLGASARFLGLVDDAVSYCEGNQRATVWGGAD